MAISQDTQPWYLSSNADFNEIGDRGCHYLSKANWTHLKVLILGSNSISDGGCKTLSQGNWSYLRQLDLSTLFFDKGQNNF